MIPVIIYTQAKCKPCHTEMEWLDAHHVAFEERSIENPQYYQELTELGATGTPTTVITGTDGTATMIIGFQSQKLQRYLHLSETS